MYLQSFDPLSRPNISLSFEYLEIGADAEYQYPIEDEEDYRIDGEAYAQVPIGRGLSFR